MLAVCSRLQSLIDWCLHPVWGGFIELDLQIEKFRLLKQEYARDNSPARW
jgi:hypothetical protein